MREHKITLGIVVCLILIGVTLPLFSEFLDERRLNHKEGIIAYFAMNSKKPTESEYLAYAKAYYYKTYKKYHEDEFEWHDKLEEIKKTLNENIKAFDIGALNYRSGHCSAELGKYDFESRGFSCIPLTPTTYLHWYEFGKRRHQRHYMKELRLFFENPSNFDFLPYPKEAANKFIKNRKDKYGRINRKVVVIVHFTLLPVKSKKCKRVLNFVNANLDENYNLVGKINEIEVYADKSLMKKMGSLIEK